MRADLEGLTAFFSLLAAWAWIKSAILAGQWRTGASILDTWLNRISTNPTVWNAIAAVLAAYVAICQGVLYLLSHPI